MSYRRRIKIHPYKVKNRGALFFSRLWVSFYKFCKGLPLLAIVFFALLFGDKIFSFVKNYSEIVANQKRIAELSLVAKNLSQIEVVAKAQIETVYTKNGKKFFKVNYFGLKEDGTIFANSSYEIEGEQLWIDSLVYNFDYMHIEEGRAKPIALPYRIYSEKVAPKDGYYIQNFYDDKGVPSQFRLSEQNIVGLTSKTFNTNLDYLFSDKTKQRELGLRSMNGNAAYVNVAVNQTYLLKALGTGGVALILEEF